MAVSDSLLGIASLCEEEVRIGVVDGDAGDHVRDSSNWRRTFASSA
jgi:hypothetical protein